MAIDLNLLNVLMIDWVECNLDVTSVVSTMRDRSMNFNSQFLETSEAI